MQRYFRYLRAFDLLSGIGSLLWGVWLTYRQGLTGSPWPAVWLLGGVLGLAMVIVNPAERLVRATQGKLFRSKGNSGNVDPGYPDPPSVPYSPPPDIVPRFK